MLDSEMSGEEDGNARMNEHALETVLKANLKDPSKLCDIRKMIDNTAHDHFGVQRNAANLPPREAVTLSSCPEAHVARGRKHFIHVSE